MPHERLAAVVAEPPRVAFVIDEGDIRDHVTFADHGIIGRAAWTSQNGSATRKNAPRMFTIPAPDASRETTATVDRWPNLALDATVADVSSEFSAS